MLNAIRRLKTLVYQAVLAQDEGEEIQRSKLNCRSSKSRSGHSLIGLQEAVGKLFLGPLGEGEVVKPRIWNVDIDEYGTESAEGEDAQTKALRLLRFEILYMACSMEPTHASTLDRTDQNYRPSPDFDTIKACRLVCKEWNEEIAAIFMAVGKPLMTVNPTGHLVKRKRQITSESVLEVLNNSICRPSTPGIRDLVYPPLKLILPTEFFYEQIENPFICNVLPSFEQYIYELHCRFPADPSMRFYWPVVKFDFLRKLFIKCTNQTKNKLHDLSCMLYNPFQNGNFMNLIQHFLNGAPYLESFTIQTHHPDYTPANYRLILPPHVTFLDVPLVKMSSEEFTDCLQYSDVTNGGNYMDDDEDGDLKYCQVKHLIIRCPLKTHRRLRRDDDIPPTHAIFLLEKYGDTLEQLQFDISGQEMDHFIWTMRREFVYEPLNIKFPKPLKQLTKLTLHAGNWEIVGMTNYAEFLPKLKTLELTMLIRESQIKCLYQTQNNTVERLKVSLTQQMPTEVIRGFAENFSALRELEVIIKEKSPAVYVCLQRFLTLRKLQLMYTSCDSEEGKEVLNSAVSGIPIENVKALMKREMEIGDAMDLYEDNPSMRNLQELEELNLILRCHSNCSTMDASIMLRTTFLRMPNLKQLTFSDKSIYIEDDQKDYIRKENKHGLLIKWEP